MTKKSNEVEDIIIGRSLDISRTQRRLYLKATLVLGGQLVRLLWSDCVIDDTQ